MLLYELMKGDKIMDNLKVNLSTKFMKGIVGKMISRLIRKHLGYDVDIQINNVEVKMEDKQIHIHLNADGKLSKEEFIKIIKSIG